MLRGLAIAMLLATPLAGMASSRASASHRHHSATIYQDGGAHHRTKAPGVKRDAHGKIDRDPRQKASFRKNHPCPSTGRTTGACPGYEVDHVKPLACGGADSAVNMQWLSSKENRAKGARECGR